eukprot:scaffold7544_cov107-Isochrysis_galbana.AAC.8
MPGSHGNGERGRAGRRGARGEAGLGARGRRDRRTCNANPLPKDTRARSSASVNVRRGRPFARQEAFCAGAPTFFRSDDTSLGPHGRTLQAHSPA